MYLDLICDNNYVNVNLRMVHLAGLSAAAYMAELLNILREVQRKGSFDHENYFFTLNREYVSERLSMSVEEQLECDTLLKKLGIVDYDPADRNRIVVRPEAYTNVITAEEVKPVKKLKVNQSEAKAAKKAGMIAGMTSCAKSILPEFLHEYVPAWVEAVYANSRFLTKNSLTLIRETLAEYPEETQKEILKRMTINGYVDVKWMVPREATGKVANTLGVQKQSAGLDPNHTY